MNAAAELGYPSNVDLNGKDHIGFTIAQANNRDGARLSTNKAYISPILDRSNLFVSMESMVSENTGPGVSQRRQHCQDYLKQESGTYLVLGPQW
jgi:choline dehydrogenase-like flavoprotein